MEPNQNSLNASGIAIFGYRNAGVLVSEAGVPASPKIQSGRIYVDVEGRVNTGIALANPSNQDASVSFNFTDSAGNDFGQGIFTPGAGRQMSASLNEHPFYSPTTAHGTFTFISTVPISVVAVRGLRNERGDFLITTLPVSPIGNAPGGVVVRVVAHRTAILNAFRPTVSRRPKLQNGIRTFRRN